MEKFVLENINLYAKFNNTFHYKISVFILNTYSNSPWKNQEYNSLLLMVCGRFRVVR